MSLPLPPSLPPSTDKRDSPTLGPMGNSHKDSSLTEEKGNPLVFDVTLIQGATSFETEAATDQESEQNQISSSTSSPTHSWTCILWFLIADLLEWGFLRMEI